MKQIHIKNVVKLAGAYVAYLIGSGFATGQEILQFYTAYGKASILGVLVSMFLFSWAGGTIMSCGYDEKTEKEIHGYKKYCGKYLGALYEWFVVVFLACILIIMISGAGATLNECFGLPHYVGTIVLAILVYITYVLGLKRLVDIIGAIGPVIIILTLLVGLITIGRTGLILGNVDVYVANANIPKASSNALISGILYVAYNIFSAVIFLSALGQYGNSRKESQCGGIFGGILIMSATFVVNLAFLANAEKIGQLSIPTLFLARQISPVLEIVFSVVIMLGIFSTASPVGWTVCDRFVKEGTTKSRVFAALLMIVSLACGQLPFGKLVGTIYPLTGYLGILLLICIALYRIRQILPVCKNDHHK